jgi:AAA domain
MTVTGDAWAVADPTLCPICGRESCKDHLPAPPADEAPAEAPRLRAVRACDVMQEAAPVEILEGVAWAGCVTVMPAESGSGKTFVALDQAAAISSGFSWHGRDVIQGSVVHVSYEGDALGLRLRAMRDTRQARLEHVYVIRASNPLSPIVTREGEQRSVGERDIVAALDALQQTIEADGRPPIRLVVFDTVRASLDGSEDSSECVSAFLRAVRRILARMPGAAALLIHHTGWQDGDNQRKRERGSSAFRGNVDATIYLEAGPYDPVRECATLTLTTKKVRDGERPAPLRMTRQRVSLDEQDRHGNPLTSCVIDPDHRTTADMDAERTQATAAAHQALDLTVLRAMQDHPAATSIRHVRAFVGGNHDTVASAVARVVCAGWAVEGKRGKPYVVTEAGVLVLKGRPV